MGCNTSSIKARTAEEERLAKGKPFKIDGNYYLKLGRQNQKLSSETEKQFYNVVQNGCQEREENGTQPEAQTARDMIPVQKEISLSKLDNAEDKKKPMRPNELPPLKEATQMKQKLIHVTTQNQKKQSDQPMGEVFATGPAQNETPRVKEESPEKRIEPKPEETTIVPFEEVKADDDLN